jgi:hypothetical protein
MRAQSSTNGQAAPAWWKLELQRGAVMFLYLWTLLALFVLNEGLASHRLGEHLTLQGFALMNALILTKVMLASEHVNVARWFARWRRVWVIAIESAFCTLLFLIVHLLERVVVGLIHGQTLGHSMPAFGGGGLAGLLIVCLIFFVSLMPFFTFKAFARAVGPDRVRSILFGRVAGAAEQGNGRAAEDTPQR